MKQENHAVWVEFVQLVVRRQWDNPLHVEAALAAKVAAMGSEELREVSETPLPWNGFGVRDFVELKRLHLAVEKSDKVDAQDVVYHFAGRGSTPLARVNDRYWLYDVYSDDLVALLRMDEWQRKYGHLVAEDEPGVLA